MINKIFSLLLFFFIFLLTPTLVYAEKYELLDKVIVSVEKGVVTLKELENALKKNNIQFSTGNEYEKIKKEILKALIEKKLLIQYAEQIKLKPSPQEIDMVIDNIAQSNGISKKELESELKINNINLLEFKEDLEYQLIIKKIKEREIMPYVKISEYEIDAWIKENQENNNPEYNILHILVKNNNPDKKNIINLLTTKLNSENFADFAIKYSEGPNNDSGGSLGWLKIEEIPEIFLLALKNMNKGDVSKKIISENGIHYLKLVDIKNDGSQKISQREYKFQQILLKKNAINSDLDLEKKLNLIKNEIEAGLPFTDAVKKYSDDQFNQDENKLSWVPINNLVKEFKDKLNLFPEKKVIGPFKTDLGWHLLKIYDFREHDITMDTKRNSAKLQIAQKKTEIRYLDWLDALYKNSKITYLEY